MNTTVFRCAIVAAVAWIVGVAPARADEVTFTVQTMDGTHMGEIVINTNEHSSGAGSIDASYEPPDGTTTAEAATELWGDHLNWVNVVVSGTPGSTPDDPDNPGTPANFPMLDPLPGGNGGGAFVELDADDLPFYLDENNDNDDGGASAQDLSDNLFDDFLLFEDAPVFNAAVTWKFNTYLASINGEANASDTDKTFHLAAGFMWTFTEDAMGNRSISNVMEIPLGNVFLYPHLDLVNKAMDDHAATKDWEAVSHIPEPASLALMLPIVLFASRRRSR